MVREELLSKEEEERKKTEHQRKLEMQEALNTVWDKIEVAVLKAAPGLDIEAVKRLAENTDLDESSPQMKAYALYAGQLLPEVQREVRRLQAELAKLKRRVGGKRKATPGARGNRSTSPPSAKSDESFLDAVFSQLGE
jgi:hypothetical protein